MKRLWAIFNVLAVLGSLPAHSANMKGEQADTLDHLLEQVRNGRTAEKEINAKREAEFLAHKEDQAALLKQAETELAREEKLSEALEGKFEQNELRIGDLENRLTARLGNLGELVGVVRLVAGDTSNILEASIVSAQFPGRAEELSKIVDNRELPSTEELRSLWFSLQKEMTENGKVSRFRAPVVLANGEEELRDVVRVGAFNALSNGQYLTYLPSVGRLAELSKQPAARYLDLAEEFEAASDNITAVAIDPTRGALLALLLQTPNLWERIAQGGIIGIVIICVALVGLGVVLERTLYLFVMDRRIRMQLASDKARPDNPLGHVIAAYENHRNVDIATLELKLDEAVLHGIPKLERGLPTIRVLAAVAPLLGLLGTVIGMIETFQSITLFGTGDPKFMAGGISQALVTTALGLITAIPLVLMYTAVRARSSRLIHILEEQSAGIVALRAESAHKSNE